jgi:hypothetical protein
VLPAAEVACECAAEVACECAAEVAWECATLPALLPAAEVMRELATDACRLAVRDDVALPCFELRHSRAERGELTCQHARRKARPRSVACRCKGYETRPCAESGQGTRPWRERARWEAPVTPAPLCWHHAPADRHTRRSSPRPKAPPPRPTPDPNKKQKEARREWARRQPHRSSQQE